MDLNDSVLRAQGAPYAGTAEDFEPYFVGYVEAPRRGPRRGVAHRGRPRAAAHRHADGARLVLVPAPGDGRLPVNTGGGYLANGEPIGASGLRQVHEIVLQLRGEAGERQVPGRCRVGFTQAYGAPGVSACTVLSR